MCHFKKKKKKKKKKKEWDYSFPVPSPKSHIITPTRSIPNAFVFWTSERWSLLQTTIECSCIITFYASSVAPAILLLKKKNEVNESLEYL